MFSFTFLCKILTV